MPTTKAPSWIGVFLSLAVLISLHLRGAYAVRINVVEHPVPDAKPVALMPGAFNYRPFSVLSQYANGRVYACWINEGFDVYVSKFDSESFALVEHKLVATEAQCAGLHVQEDGTMAVFTRRRADTRNDEGVLHVFEPNGSKRGSVTFPEGDLVGLEPRIAFSNDPVSPYYAVFFKDIYGGHGVSAVRFLTTEPRLLDSDEYTPEGIDNPLNNMCSHSLEERVVWNDAASEWAFMCRSDFFPEQGFSIWAHGFRATLRAPPCVPDNAAHASDTGELFTDGGTGYVMSLTNVNRELPEVTICEETAAEDLVPELAWMHVTPCDTCDDGFELTNVFLTDTPGAGEHAPTNAPFGNAGQHLVVFKRGANDAFAMIIDNEGNVIEGEEQIGDRVSFSGRENFVPLPNGDVFFVYFWDTYFNGTTQNQARRGTHMKLVRISPGEQSDEARSEACVDMTGWLPTDFEELGCFADSDDNGFGVLNGLRTDFFSLPTLMTYETCSEYCWRFKYFGIRGHNMCFCGDNEDYDRNGASGACSATCDGNQSLACGGSWKIRVFEHKTFESRPPDQLECGNVVVDSNAAQRPQIQLRFAAIASVFCALLYYLTA